MKNQERAAPVTAEITAEPALDEHESECAALVAGEEAIVDVPSEESEEEPTKIGKKDKERKYNLHDTARAESLVGSPLATFKQRFIAFAIDFLIVCIVGSLVASLFPLFAVKVLHLQPYPEELMKGATNLHLGTANFQVKFPEDPRTEKIVEIIQLILTVLYFGLSNWLTNGLTLGKRILKIRVASLTHERITLWQSCERALGYGASALEAGFGFFQFFIYPNRTCVHDRIAETIVIEDPPRESKAAKKEAELVKAVAREEAEEAREMDEEVLKESSTKGVPE